MSNADVRTLLDERIHLLATIADAELERRKLQAQLDDAGRINDRLRTAIHQAIVAEDTSTALNILTRALAGG